MLPSLSRLEVPTAGKKSKTKVPDSLGSLPAGPAWEALLLDSYVNVVFIAHAETLKVRRELNLGDEPFTLAHRPYWLEKVLQAYYLAKYLPTMTDAVLQFHKNWIKQLASKKNWKDECTNAPEIQQLMDTVGVDMAKYCYQMFWKGYSGDAVILEVMNIDWTSLLAETVAGGRTLFPGELGLRDLAKALDATVNGSDYTSKKELGAMQLIINEFNTKMQAYWPRLERLYIDTRARLTQLAPPPPPPPPPPSVYTPAPPAPVLDPQPYRNTVEAATEREEAEAAAALAAKKNEDTRRKRDQEQRARATQELEKQDQRRPREPGSSSSPSSWETAKAALRAEEEKKRFLDAKKKDIAEEHERILVQKAAARIKDAAEAARLAERVHALEIADGLTHGK